MENHVGAVWYFIHDYNAQQSKGLSRYHYYRITTIKVSDKPKGKLVRECDEMWSLVFSKTIKVYIWLAIDRKTREIIGCYLGDRSRQSAKKLWARPTRRLPTMCGCLHRLLGVI
jgi:hypothetical protein